MKISKSSSLSISCIQFDPISANCYEDVRKNTDRILDYMERAATGNPGVDLIVFPECCFQGMAPVNWINVAMTLEDEPIKRVREKCRELKTWGIFNPWIRPADGSFIENVALIVDEEGEIAGTYVKMNPALPVEPTKPGTKMKVFDGPKGARMAVLICADAEFSECWREAALLGANVVFHISHWFCPGEELWEITNRAGAAFNGYYVIAVNSIGTDEAYSYFGNSMVVSPGGHIQYTAPQIPCVFSTRINLEQLDAERRNGFKNLLWQSYHRGAASPDEKGFGRDYSDYRACMCVGTSCSNDHVAPVHLPKADSKWNEVPARGEMRDGGENVSAGRALFC